MRGLGLWAFLTLVALAAGVAGCGGASGEEATGQERATPAGKAETANFKGVHSGEVELVLEIKRYEKKPEVVKMRILGNFMKAGEEALPQVDLAIESKGDLAGRHIEFLSSPLLRDDKWVVNFAGKVYEPDHATFEELRSKFEEAEDEEGGAGNALACLEAAEGFDFIGALHRFSFEPGGEAIDGTRVETVGADLDVSAVVDELIKMTEGSPGCRAQLQALGLPPPAELEALDEELKDSLAATRLTLSIDKNGVVRYFRILANVERPRGGETLVETYFRLNRVNEVTELPITHGYSPYPTLLKQFGLTDEDVEQAEGKEIWIGILGVLADRVFGREGG